MNREAFRWAWQQHVAPMPRVTLMTLAELSDGTWCCRISIREISHHVRASPRAVRDALQRLEDVKLLAKRAENGTIAEYRLQFSASFGLPPLPPRVRRINRDTAALRRQTRIAHARRLGTHTPEQWAALVAACGGACVKCQRTPRPGLFVTKDHIRALARGGSDAIENLQPLCGPCNAAKGTRDWGDLRPAGWRGGMA